MDCLLFLLWLLSCALAFLLGMLYEQQRPRPGGNGTQGNGERMQRAAL